MTFNTWLDQLNIPQLNHQAMNQTKHRLDALCKPNGGLGRLEKALLKLAGIKGNSREGGWDKAVIIFAGDHGVVDEGVSQFSAQDTAKMVAGIIQGKTAVAVLAQQLGIPLVCWDVGLKWPVCHQQGRKFPLQRAKVKPGTANFRLGPAMSQLECEQAMLVGVQAVRNLPQQTSLIALGEMGMGNTTVAAALTADLLQVDANKVVGRGAGNLNLHHKRQVVRQALRANMTTQQHGPFQRMAALGGLELSALAGACLEAAAQGKGVILDGFVTSAAALVAARMRPEVLDYLFASHLSPEPGHCLLLTAMGLEPLLDLELRVGEGAGALLLFPLLEQAMALHGNMATFDELGIGMV